MGYRDIRVIVVSRDYEFYRSIDRGIAEAGEVESVSNLTDLLAVQGRMHRMLSNVIIMDLDTCQATTAYLQQLVEKNKLLVILTSGTPAVALRYKVGSIRDSILKPRAQVKVYIEAYVRTLLTRMREFSSATPVMSYHSMQRTVDVNQKIIVIASSTGGPEAVEHILKKLPADVPPVLIVQHMPSGFTKFFATRLNSICPVEVREAEDNDYLQKGLVLIAPAGKHMKLVRRGSKLMVECAEGAKIHGVMPAADVLFESVANVMKKNVIGVILTGMGADGAKGMMLMHINGAKTIGQDQQSCVVYGMPKVAYDMGALDMQLPLDRIAEAVLSLVRG